MRMRNLLEKPLKSEISRSDVIDAQWRRAERFPLMRKKMFRIKLNERRAQEMRNVRSSVSLQAPDSRGNVRENDKPESN